MTDKRLEEALRHLHPPSGTKLWHGGATILGALRGLSPQVAAWKPYSDRHSIWELALHDTYHAGQIQMMKRLARSSGV